MKTKVIFRKFKDGEIMAVFPEEPADVYGRYCVCYVHNGQHGQTPAWLYTSFTSPAKPSEYAHLKNELEMLCGYELEIYSRQTPQMRQVREAEAKRLRGE